MYCLEKEFLRNYLEKINRPFEAKFTVDIGPKQSVWRSPGDGVAVLEIRGVLSDSPKPIAVALGMLYTTYAEILQALDEISKSDLYRTIVLDIDSPGGYAEAGLDHTWQKLMEIRKTKKVIVINNGIIASGAYWIASAANEIYSTSLLNQQGSIGVYSVYYDWSEFDKKSGIKEIKIRSSNAPNKAKGPEDKGFEDDIQRDLNYVESIFIESISKGRGISKEKVIESFGKGALLPTDEALKIGMLDGIIAPNQNLSKPIEMISVQTTSPVKRSFASDGLINTEEDLRLALSAKGNKSIVQPNVTSLEINSSYEQTGIISSAEDYQRAIGKAGNECRSIVQPNVTSPVYNSYIETQEDYDRAIGKKSVSNLSDYRNNEIDKTQDRSFATDGQILNDTDYKLAIERSGNRNDFPLEDGKEESSLYIDSQESFDRAVGKRRAKKESSKSYDIEAITENICEYYDK